MKILKVTALLLLVSFSINAQYQSLFGQNSTEWSELLTNFFGSQSVNYSVGGDTMIATVNYKKVVGGDQDFFLREDTTNGKVWVAVFDFFGLTEYIVADYSLAVGDTFLINNGMGIPSGTAQVDSVFFQSGRKYVRFNYGNVIAGTANKLTFIEGIGTTFGLLYQPQIFNLLPYLLCKLRDNVQEFTNAIFNGNCIVTGLPNDEDRQDIRLMKHGDSYVIYINDNSEPMEIKISDMQGRLMKAEYTPTDKGEVFVSLAGFSSGIYIISICTQKFYYSTKITN